MTEAVEDEEAMAALKLYIPALEEDILKPQAERRALLYEQLQVCNNFQFREMDKTLIERYTDAEHWPATSNVDKRRREKDLAGEQRKFEEILNSEKEKFHADFAEWQGKLESIKTEMTDFSKAKEYDKVVNGYITP